MDEITPVVCSECEQPIHRHAGTKTGWIHKRWLPKWCDSKAPVPKEKTS